MSTDTTSDPVRPVATEIEGIIESEGDAAMEEEACEDMTVDFEDSKGVAEIVGIGVIVGTSRDSDGDGSIVTEGVDVMMGGGSGSVPESGETEDMVLGDEEIDMKGDADERIGGKEVEIDGEVVGAAKPIRTGIVTVTEGAVDIDADGKESGWDDENGNNDITDMDTVEVGVGGIEVDGEIVFVVDGVGDSGGSELPRSIIEEKGVAVGKPGTNVFVANIIAEGVNTGDIEGESDGRLAARRSSGLGVALDPASKICESFEHSVRETITRAQELMQCIVSLDPT